MEYLVLAVNGWAVVITLIPLEIIRDLIMVPVIAFIWIVIVDNIYVALNYYRFTHALISIGYSPLFQSLAAAAVGMLMINWLTPHPLSKLASSLLASAFLVVVREVYVQFIDNLLTEVIFN